MKTRLVPTLAVAVVSVIAATTAVAQDTGEPPVNPRFAPAGPMEPGRFGVPDTPVGGWANQEEIDAAYAEGLKHWTGDGVPQDDARAVEKIRDAAKWGHADALYLLAQAYDEGRGVAADPAKAMEYFHQAAMKGVDEAQYRYGRAYLDGDNVKAEPAWGMTWVAKAADAGLPRAQYDLAVALKEGIGMPADATDALAWAILAEQGGVAEAAELRAGLADEVSEVARLTAESMASKWQAVSRGRWVDGWMVRFVQHALNTLGYDVEVNPQGRGDRATIRAIGQYASDHKVPGGTMLSGLLVKRLREDLGKL